MKNPKKLERWPEQKMLHHQQLRKKLALSFGNFDEERRVRTDLIGAIRTCDETRIARIAVKGYDQRQTQDIQYTAQEIEMRRALIEEQLQSILPRDEIEVVKGEIFGALRVENAGVDLLKLSPEQKVKLKESGLADYVDLHI